MITVNAKLICKLTLNEEDVQNQLTHMKENTMAEATREDAIYALAFAALPIDLNVKDAEFTEL